MLDLTQPRGVGDLVATTLRVWVGHLGVFLVLTALVVVPVMLLVDGVWGRQLTDGPDADAPLGAGIVSAVLSFAILPPIVAALHVRVVQALGRGEAPTIRRAIGEAAPRFAAACLAVMTAAVVTAVGLVFAVIPGIWLFIRLYFVAYAVVVDEEDVSGALRRSARLVRGRWWRVAGTGLVLWLLPAAIGFPADVLARAVDGVGGTAVLVVSQVLTLSLEALGATLFYFSLRAEQGPTRST